MKQYTQREFIKICIANGFYYNRHNGGHAIYINDKGKHISIPMYLESVIAHRLIRENNLEVNIKKLRKSRKMNSYDYPLGSDNSDAPWNQGNNPEKEVEVLISVTLSKTVKVKVTDYSVIESGRDEDGEYFEEIECSDYTLKRAVEKQIKLPQDKFKDWAIDEFEIVQE